MKTFKVISILLLSSGMVLFTNCGLKKMVKKQTSVSYSVTPNPLETHGGKMTMEIQGNFPKKYFNKKATLSLVPVIKSSTGETTTLQTINLEGEKVNGNNTVIGYKSGGKFTITQTIDYKPAYQNCELMLTSSAKLKTKEASLNEIKLAEGTIATSERVSVQPSLAYKGQSANGSFFVFADHNYTGPKIIEKTAVIFFEVNRDVLNWNLPFNKKEENKQALKDLMSFVSQYKNVESVDIVGWASPEGELKRNQELSSKRSETGKKWFESEYNKTIKAMAKKEKKDEKELKKEITYNLKDNGEDWDGFIEAVNNSSIQDKSQIVNVIKSQSDLDQREQQIRNMIAIYNEIDNEILPSLRRAIVKANCLENKKTDEQIAQMAANQPDSLNNDELLYAASLTTNLKTKADIFKKATEIYPNDYRAYNDLACIKASEGNFDEAKKLLDKANSLSPNKGEMLNNQGIIALLSGDYENAKKYFEASQKADFNQDYNLGIVSMKTGDYTSATNAFSATKCNYNVALNQILTKDYTAAKSTIDCIQQKAAKDYYLLAIIGARTNDTNILFKNLSKACELDSDFKTQALKDMEFKNFKDNAAFKDAVK